MNPKLKQLIEAFAELFLNYSDPQLDVFECLNRNEDDPADLGREFAIALNKLVHRMRQRYFKTQVEAEIKKRELERQCPEYEYKVRRTSMNKYLIVRS